jgi:hypothetical protein
MNSRWFGPAVLLQERCPTGKHPGAVVAEYKGMFGRELSVPWPPLYVCGCEDPRAGR